VNLSSLTAKAKAVIARRGGTESLKQDADELKDIAKGPGTTGDKAKAAYEAIKDPGAPGNQGGAPREEPGVPGDQRAAPRDEPGPPGA
jgi:hypothetical protein